MDIAFDVLLKYTIYALCIERTGSYIKVCKPQPNITLLTFESYSISDMKSFGFSNFYVTVLGFNILV